MNISWIHVLVICTAATIGYASYLIINKPDGVVEQVAEAVLKTEGIDIDLSPDNG